MESLTIRLSKELAQKIEENLIPYYSTKTEFIREAIRDKLKSLEKESKPKDPIKVRKAPLSAKNRQRLFEEYKKIPNSEIIKEINKQKRNTDFQ